MQEPLPDPKPSGDEAVTPDQALSKGRSASVGTAPTDSGYFPLACEAFLLGELWLGEHVPIQRSHRTPLKVEGLCGTG